MTYDMNLEYMVSRYYRNHANSFEEIKIEINNMFDSNVISNIESIYFNIFYEQIKQYPKSYWDIQAARKTYHELVRRNNIYEIDLSLEIFQYYIYARNNYEYITNIVNDLSYVNESDEIKSKMYRLPTYINIVEGIISNLFRFIVLVINQDSESDYSSQQTLGQLVNVLKSNEFEFLANYVDVDIRNSINHGLVSFSKQSNPGKYEIISDNYIIFRYRKGGELREKKITISEFERLIDQTYDSAGGILMGLTIFLNNNLNKLLDSIEEDEYMLNELLRMQISIPGISCKSIFKTKNIQDEMQLNVELKFEDGDIGKIAEMVYNISFLIHNIYGNSDVDVYFFGINHIRSNKGWIKLYKKDIEDTILGKQKIDSLCKKNIKEGKQIIWPPSNEEINLREIKYHKFQNYISEDLRILNIQDASIEDIKRLRGDAYIGGNYDREEVIKKVKFIISWMNKIENIPCLANKIKHGKMESDVLYINIYESDERRSRKDISSSNNNFVCRVEYTRDLENRIKDSGLPKIVYNSLYIDELKLDEELDSSCLILWKDKGYRTVRKSKKIGRNEPCPCGSGKKYKQCCEGK